MRTQTIPCIDNVVGPNVSGNPVSEELVLLIDLSGSMNSKDWSPSRLHGAKDACLALLERKYAQRPQDRVGIVTFASSACIKHKLIDIRKGKQSLDIAVNGLNTDGWTAMGTGLITAGRLLGVNTWEPPTFWENPISWILSPFARKEISPPSSDRPGGNRRIILLTDGGNTESIRPVSIATKLKDGGIAIDCIGIGGSPADVDENELKEIASVGRNGKPRYWFIGEKAELVETFQELATSIRGIG